MARYAWFALPPYKALGLSVGSSDGALTPVGRAYAAAGAAPPASPTPTPSPPAATPPPVTPPPATPAPVTPPPATMAPVTPPPATPAPVTPPPATPAPATPPPATPAPSTTAAPAGPPPSTAAPPTTQSPAAAAHAKKVRPATPPTCICQRKGSQGVCREDPRQEGKGAGRVDPACSRYNPDICCRAWPHGHSVGRPQL